MEHWEVQVDNTKKQCHIVSSVGTEAGFQKIGPKKKVKKKPTSGRVPCFGRQARTTARWSDVVATAGGGRRRHRACARRAARQGKTESSSPNWKSPNDPRFRPGKSCRLKWLRRVEYKRGQ